MTDTYDFEEERKNCPICGGRGWLDVTKDPLYPTDAPCRCTLRHRFKAKVGGPIFNAKRLESSPFEDYIKEDTYILAYEPNFRPHLRRALACAGLSFFSRVITDQRLMDAWLNKEQQASAEMESDVVHFSSVRDIAASPDLLVLNLGVMGYKNKALAGIIHEACNMRRYEGKPTWIVCPPNAPIKNQDVFYHSNSLDLYVTEHFRQETVGGDVSFWQPTATSLDSGLEEVKGNVDPKKIAAQKQQFDDFLK